MPPRVLASGPKPCGDKNNTDRILSLSVTEYRDLVRWMLNVNPAERASADEAFRSPWCMQAIKDNPELRYLEETIHPVLVRMPSECALQEEDEFGERRFPRH